MVDLHLFLGRPLVEAQKDSGDQDDGLFGSVPQTIIDAEQNFLKTAHDKAHGLVSLLIYHQRRRHYIVIITKRKDSFKPIIFLKIFSL